MLDYRGFSAWITTEDEELVEFESRFNDKTNTVTCWIAGPVGKTFVVHWRDHGSKVDSASYIQIDGHRVSGQFLFGEGEELRRGVRVGPDEERPFVFSAITPGDCTSSDAKPADKNVGSVVLDVLLVRRVEEREPNPICDPPEVVRGHRQEGDVAIRYGNARATAVQQRTWKLQPFDPNTPGVHVSFVFRYRSQDWLVSQGIIEPNDAITTSEEHPPVEKLSKAEFPEEVLDEYNRTKPALTSPQNNTEPQSKPEPEEEDELPEDAPSREMSLSALGHGPRPGSPTAGTSRVTSDSTIRSFSGTWDPNPTGVQQLEDWTEYNPEEYTPDDLDEAFKNYDY